MACIIIRKNTYFASFYVNGKNLRLSTKVHVKPTDRDGGLTARELKKIAQAAADGIESMYKRKAVVGLAMAAVQAAAAAVGAEIGESVPTLEEYAHYWLSEIAIKKKSYPTARKAVSRFIELSGIEAAKAPISAYTKAQGHDYVDKCIDLVSYSTVDRDLEELCSMFNRAIAERKLSDNPLKGLRPPKWAQMDTQERRAFTQEEINIIFTQFPAEWRDMVAVCLLLGGQRLGDIATLRWSQFDMQRGICRIVPKKTPKNMVKPIVPPLRTLLERRQAGMAGQTEYVFPYAAARYGQSGDKSNKLSLEFRDLLIRHGIMDTRTDKPRAKHAHFISALSFHSLRTTATTLLLNIGTPPEMVRRIVGHDDPEIERAHYYRPTIDEERAWMQLLSDKLSLR